MATFAAPLIPDITDSMRAQSLGFNYGNQVRQNALARSAGQMAAGGNMGGAANALLAGGELDAGFGVQDRMRKLAKDADEEQLAKSARANDLFFRLASVADTPEKWSMATSKLKQMGVDTSGFDDFNAREMALARFGQTKDVIGSVLEERKARAIGQALMPQQGQAPVDDKNRDRRPTMNNAVNSWKAGIASIETPGEANPYQALGPVVRSGDRAYGKYQVMGANVGPWTREILGREMSPEEFLASPEAQEKVFEGKFGQYVQRTGSPEAAASMWFTGRPSAPNAQARDAQGNPIGIKGSEYVQRFSAGLGGGAPQQAQPGPRPVGFDYQAGARAALQAGDIGTAMKLDEMGRPKKGSFEFTKYGIGNKDTGDLQPYADGFAGDPETKITDITSIRKEASSNTNVKKFDDAIGSYQSMLVSATSDNATSDLDMIYGLAKIMDPESVVREGEFETVRNSSSIPNQIKGYWEFLLKGKGKLDAATRQEILGIASNRLNAYRGEAIKSMDRYRSIAEKQRIDPSLIVRDFPEVPQHKPKQDMTPDQIKDKYRQKYGIQP